MLQLIAEMDRMKMNEHCFKFLYMKKLPGTICCRIFSF